MQTTDQTQAEVSPKGWARVLLIFFPFLIVVGLFQLVGYLILGLDLSNREFVQSPFQSMVVMFFTLGGTIFIIQLFRKHVDKESFQSMGFYPANLIKESIVGLVLGAAIMAVGFVSLILLGEIKWESTNFEPDSFLYSVGLFIAIAITEELYMRGYVLNNLMKSMPRFAALLVSSVYFSLMHVVNPHFSWFSFFDLTLAGMLLGFSYIYTKSLWFPIALHFSWNFFQGTIFGFPVSGKDLYSVIHQSHTTSNILNGGGFGFEGSILSVIFQVIVIFFIWRFYTKRKIYPAGVD